MGSTELNPCALRQWPVPIPHRPGALDRYLRWRNAKARHPDVLAAQRKEDACIRKEKGIRWSGRPSPQQPDRSTR
ncbi:hypothetical protein [Streptomyces sp. SD31]|uniref:hypothetical protein n=1 Tax=Streptomyces sp. SD31 TaxID=3452208 RepID=UPI003F8B0C36